MIRKIFSDIKMAHGHRLFICFSMLLLAGTVAAAGPPAAPIVVEKALERKLAPIVWVTGDVISRNNARISAETSGRLVWVAEVGDEISKNSVIARIDNDLLKLQLDESRAEVTRVESQRGFLEKEVKRLRRLAKSNNAAQTLLDKTEANLASERANYLSAQSRMKQIEDRIRRSHVRAPFPGIIVQRFMQPGEWVDSGDQIVQLLDTNALEVRVMASLSVMPFLSKGMEVHLKSGDEQAKGRIRSFVAAGLTASHLVDVRIDLSYQAWPVGKTLRVAMPASAPRNVVVVPRDALVLRRNGAVAFRVTKENTAERVVVRTGVAQDSFIEVIGDIVVGDTVVVRGNERLRPGQKVRISTAGSG